MAWELQYVSRPSIVLFAFMPIAAGRSGDEPPKFVFVSATAADADIVFARDSYVGVELKVTYGDWQQPSSSYCPTALRGALHLRGDIAKYNESQWIEHVLTRQPSVARIRAVRLQHSPVHGCLDRVQITGDAGEVLAMSVDGLTVNGTAPTGLDAPDEAPAPVADLDADDWVCNLANVFDAEIGADMDEALRALRAELVVSDDAAPDADNGLDEEDLLVDYADVPPPEERGHVLCGSSKSVDMGAFSFRGPT